MIVASEPAAGPTLIKATDRRSVLIPPRRRAIEEKLIFEQFTGEDVAFGEADEPFDVHGRHDLAMKHKIRKSGKEFFDRLLHRIPESVPLGLPIAIREVIGSIHDEA